MFSILIAAAAAAVTIPAEPELTRQIAARDAEFFQLFFQGCDPDRARAMVTDDLEFYHDKDGLIATSGAALVGDYAKGCAAKKAPDAWRSRRELVAGTLRVWPVPGFGAIEQGEHVFYERKGDGPEKLVGRAAFTQVWQLTPTGWKLARVLSYAHAPVP
jgi:hypothetical protein